MGGMVLFAAIGIPCESGLDCMITILMSGLLASESRLIEGAFLAVNLLL